MLQRIFFCKPTLERQFRTARVGISDRPINVANNSDTFVEYDCQDCCALIGPHRYQGATLLVSITFCPA